MINQIPRYWLPVAIGACALFVSIVYYSPPLLDKNIIDDDVFQHLFWMGQYSDTDLFQNDLLTDYAKAVQPIGTAALYRILSSVIDPILLSKILPIPLFMLAVVLIYFIGVRLAGRFNGALCAATLMATPSYLIKMEGGLPRSFALPLLLLFILLMLNKKYIWASIVVVIQAVFYPLISPVCLIILGMGLFFPVNKVRRTGLQKSLLPMVIAIAGGLSLFMNQSISARKANIGTPLTSHEVQNNSEYARGGRYVIEQQFLPSIGHNFSRGTFYSRFPDIDLNWLNDWQRDSYRFTFLGLFIVAICLAWYSDFLRIDPILHYLLIASVLMYALAYLFMLRLYIPVRQLEFTIPIWALLIQSQLISKGISALQSHRARNAVRVVILSGILIVCAVMVQASISPANYSKRELVDLSEYTELYDILKKLPKDIVIASHPSSADPIPTMTGRKVLFNTAMALPFFGDYWSKVKFRALNFATVYYSDDMSDLVDFCRKFDVDYIIVNTSHFSTAYLSKNHTTWEPYNAWEKSASSNKSDFALLSIPEENKLYIDEKLFVVSAENLEINRHRR
jgi:hypothetical protein